MLLWVHCASVAPRGPTRKEERAGRFVCLGDADDGKREEHHEDHEIMHVFKAHEYLIG